ncbi:MAG: glucose-6-phosphate dehydrogenase, partial [Beijerinckiaceae bacterium]
MAKARQSLDAAALDPSRSLVPDFDLVLFGATGDLATRKLFPAMLHRDTEGVFPTSALIHAAGRSPMDDDAFRRSLQPALATVGASARQKNEFLRKIRYYRIDFDTPRCLDHLAAALSKSDRTRAYYLSIAPQYFAPVSEKLGAAGLVTPGSRIVIEKPIGHDRASASAIMDAIGKVFSEKQTYRIDHYLGKETVQNLLVLRFANTLFGRLWSNADIDHVQITVAEQVGLETRAGYYEGAGALRDMV